MERITVTSILLGLSGLLIAKILSRTGNDKAAIAAYLEQPQGLHFLYEKVCPAIYPRSHVVCAASDLGYCNRNCMVAFDSICETSGTVEVR